MGVHTFDPSQHSEDRQINLCEFKINSVYAVRSRATWRETLSQRVFRSQRQLTVYCASFQSTCLPNVTLCCDLSLGVNFAGPSPSKTYSLFSSAKIFPNKVRESFFSSASSNFHTTCVHDDAEAVLSVKCSFLGPKELHFDAAHEHKHWKSP